MHIRTYVYTLYVASHECTALVTFTYSYALQYEVIHITSYVRMFCNIYSLIPNIIFFSVGQPTIDPLDLIDLHLDTMRRMADSVSLQQSIA